MGVKNLIVNFLTVNLTNYVVQQGPFRGLQYIDNSVGSTLPPKLMGTYERELIWVIDEMISTEPDIIIDIGAAEGYYAVGLAMLYQMPELSLLRQRRGGEKIYAKWQK